MKNIDDLIEKYRIMSAKGCILFPQRPDIAEKSNLQYKETADYLEELKAYRENDGISENVYRAGCNFSYNKAIDDFADLISEKSHVDLDEAYMDGGSTVITTKEVFEIAEQLKGTK